MAAWYNAYNSRQNLLKYIFYQSAVKAKTLQGTLRGVDIPESAYAGRRTPKHIMYRDWAGWLAGWLSSVVIMRS